jgi:hypothetical protein
MIAEANREIRWQLRVAERRRQDRAKGIVPFSYVDSLIAELEAMHLDGLRAIPASFLARLLAVNRLLPGGIEPLLGWGCRIRDAIGQCFELQERLLALRDPGYVQRLEADQEADSYLREDLEA